MGKLQSEEGIRAAEHKHGFKTKKSLGQNFLADSSVIDDLVASLDLDKETLVFEIGPGLGVLTQKFAEESGKVIAVEIDQRLIPILGEHLARFSNVKIINDDILNINIPELIEAEKPPSQGGRPKIRIAGNLPYYITTPIISGLLEQHICFDSMTFMVQKEVADRISAKPGSKEYGVLSVSVQYYCDALLVREAPASCFIPRPKVDSAVIKLVPVPQGAPEAKDEELFFNIVKASFSQRRKTLYNSLGAAYGKERAKAALDSAGIDGRRRAETLTIKEFAELSDRMSDML